MEWHSTELPIYCALATINSIGRQLVVRRQNRETVGAEIPTPGRLVVRLGFDLFREVEFLLSDGQPSENAHIPTLDMYISMLRAIMVGAGISFVEAPPVPAGYDFIACLTHDVDFVGVRDHKCDRTMWGFLYRCFVDSTLRALRGKLRWSKCLHNWRAGVTLPLVHCGLVADFWLEFDRYRNLERNLGSTFFFIPFKNAPGTLGPASAPKLRAAKYDFTKLKDQIGQLLKNGCEVGLHGIDAWQNCAKAQAESQRLEEVTGQPTVGTRMHWLYWAANSPKCLEDAGFAYDSTFGYNDAVGFRAGTTQAFRPLGAERLLELPLIIQDSAMFYSDRMDLSELEALNICRRLIDSMLAFGGALTVNWHTRSLSPERLWGDYYEQLLREIQTYPVWFGTAQEVVTWFQKRRELRFDWVESAEDGLRVALSGASSHSTCPMIVRLHHPRSAGDDAAPSPRGDNYTDVQWNGESIVNIPCVSSCTRP
jgi:hypothetical protein